MEQTAGAENNPADATRDNASAAEDEQAAAGVAGNAASPAGASADEEVGQLRARVQELEHENSDLKDQYLRKQADFENFRKRMTREKADAIAYANKQLLLDILQIIDDFERAIKSAEESRDFDSFHEGVALIEKQFTSMLERKWGLKRFDSEGEEFDPQKHEAVMTGEDGEHDKPVVLEDYQKGYFLNDKVLRSAKVKVSVPSEKSGTE
ncbi:MAG: nucleotide exchange factor GrpE [Spirochaetes bacterium]|nr:nucleotide exchange factor GrpE [Spirochaetota bacterium]